MQCQEEGTQNIMYLKTEDQDVISWDGKRKLFLRIGTVKILRIDTHITKKELEILNPIFPNFIPHNFSGIFEIYAPPVLR
jgi:hypothetical protein